MEFFSLEPFIHDGQAAFFFVCLRGGKEIPINSRYIGGRSAMTNAKKSRRAIPWAVIVIAVGILFRLGLWRRVSQTPTLLIHGDGAGYELIARNLLEGRGFSMNSAPPYEPDMLRTPGYVFFIASIYGAFGYRPEIVVLIQNILGLITLYIAYRLATRLFGAPAGLVATALMAVDMGTIILTNVTMTESPFMILLIPATYCFFVGRDSPRGRIWLAGAGLLFGLATLVRPAGLYLVILVLPFVWWNIQLPRWEKVIRSAALLVVYALALLPWSYRNLQTFGSFDISLAQSVTLTYHAKYLRAARYHTTLAEQESYFDNQVLRELDGRTVSPVEMNKLVQAKAQAEIMQHPAEYVVLYAKSIALMLVLPNTNFLANTLGILNQSTGIIADMRTRSLAESARALIEFRTRFLAGSPDQTLFLAALVAEVVVMFLTYVLASVGAIIGLRSQDKTAVVFLLVISVYFLAVTGPIGTGRYRLPAMPYLMMLAGYGMVQIQAWRQARRLRKQAAA
jgi:4-amino-4-deoxy-L-arabinose transferase-like glycosyltransferase